MAPVLEPGTFAELSAELLRRGHSVRFRAKGESMHPTIREGEAMTVEPVMPSEVRFADIILYRTKNTLTAHRVVGWRKRDGGVKAFRLRGDASIDCDEPVAEDQVLGKVVSVERGGRSIALDRRTAICWHLTRVLIYRLKRRIDRIFA